MRPLTNSKQPPGTPQPKAPLGEPESLANQFRKMHFLGPPPPFIHPSLHSSIQSSIHPLFLSRCLTLCFSPPPSKFKQLPSVAIHMDTRELAGLSLLWRSTGTFGNPEHVATLYVNAIASYLLLKKQGSMKSEISGETRQAGLSASGCIRDCLPIRPRQVTHIPMTHKQRPKGVGSSRHSSLHSNPLLRTCFLYHVSRTKCKTQIGGV